MKQTRLEACHQLLACHTNEGNDFLQNTITGGESLVHHSDLGMRSQSCEYVHPTSPRKKEFKMQPTIRKCMLTVGASLTRSACQRLK